MNRKAITEEGLRTAKRLLRKVTTSCVALVAAVSMAAAGAPVSLAAQNTTADGIATPAATAAAATAKSAKSAKATTYDGVPVGETWYDTDGNPIQAHGGGFLQDGGKYYWVGEDKSHNSANFLAVSLYESTDLLNWTKVGSILTEHSATTKAAAGGLTDIKLERPKLLKNAAGKYVLYGHWEDATGYASSQIAVATADKVEGPYTFQGHWRPGAGTEAKYRNWRSVSGSAGTIQISDADYVAVREANPGKTVDQVWDQLKAHAITDDGFSLDYDADGNAVESPMYGVGKYGYGSRDMTLFQDGKKAYLIDAEDHMSMRIHQLSDDLTDVAFTDATDTKETMSYRMFQGARLEAPAITNIDGTYYLIISTQSGWYPNQARYYTSTDITDPNAWSEQHLIGNSSTFYSQPTSIMAVTENGKTSYIYLGDRWNSKKLGSSTYIWLPLSLSKDGALSMQYAPGWRLDKTTGSIELPGIDLVSQNRPVYADAGVPQAGASTAESAAASKANDGKYEMTGFWDEGVEFYAQDKVPYTWTVDLGEVKDLSRIDTTFATANGSESRYGYILKGSNDPIASKEDADDANWTTLFDNTANTQVAFTSDKVSGRYRYVQIEVTSVVNDHNGNSTANWENGLIEVQVYANRLGKAITALPEASLASGVYTTQDVTLAAEEGSAIYYTLDGSEPTEKTGTKYTGPIALAKGKYTLKAIAVAPGKAASGVITRTYTIHSADDPKTLLSTDLSGAMVAGTDMASALPKTLAFETVGGRTVNAAVDWKIPGAEDAADAPKAFDSLDVQGTVDGYDGTVTYHLEVVPDDLVYYIDSGMAGKDSVAYDAVKGSVPTLRNDAADRQYAAGSGESAGSGDGAWGANIGDVSVYSVGSEADKYNTVLGGEQGGSKKDIVYTLPVKAGTYRFSVGFKELWTGPRSMKLTLNYTDADGKNTTVALNGGDVLHVGKGYDTKLAYTSDAYTVGDGTVTLTASYGGDGDAAMVSWLAVAGLESTQEQAPRAELRAAIDHYKNTVQGQYTAGTWAAFESALKAAREVSAKSDASAADIRSAADALNAAAGALRVAADGTALQAKIDEIDGEIKAGTLVESDYTKTSWAALAEALEKATGVAGDAEASQQDVDDALAALTEARAALVRESGDKPGSGDGSNDGSDDGSGNQPGTGSGDGASGSAGAQSSGLSRTGAPVVAALLGSVALLGAAATLTVLRRARRRD